MDLKTLLATGQNSIPVLTWVSNEADTDGISAHDNKTISDVSVSGGGGKYIIVALTCRGSSNQAGLYGVDIGGDIAIKIEEITGYESVSSIWISPVTGYGSTEDIRIYTDNESLSRFAFSIYTLEHNTNSKISSTTQTDSASDEEHLYSVFTSTKTNSQVELVVVVVATDLSSPDDVSMTGNLTESFPSFIYGTYGTHAAGQVTSAGSCTVDTWDESHNSDLDNRLCRATW